jgi:cytochrome c
MKQRKKVTGRTAACARAGCHAAALAIGLSLPAASPAADPTAEALFRSNCGTCHVLAPDGAARQGPPLAGVVGRRVAAVEGFAYSDALRAQDFVWDAARLDAWLTSPQKLVPGAVMTYRQRDPEKRRILIEYLTSQSGD